MRLSLLLAAALLGAQAQAAPDLRSRNAAVADEHLLPRYQQLAETTRVLAERAGALCAQPDAAGLTATRTAYQDAMDAWQGVSHVRFGPVELLLRYHRFELWPDKRNTGSRQLAALLAAADPRALEAERFAQSSVAVQGFSALERLLYGDQQPPAGYRCDLVRAVTANLAAMAGDIDADWRGGDAPYRAALVNTGADAAFESDLAVSSKLLNNLDAQLQVIVEQKLGRVLDGKRLRVRRAESWRSGRSLRNVAVDLVALRELYLTGFAPLLAERAQGPALDARVRAGFDAAIARAQALQRPLTDLAVEPDGQAALATLQAKVGELKALVGGELPKALDIPLGFNSLDGD